MRQDWESIFCLWGFPTASSQALSQGRVELRDREELCGLVYFWVTRVRRDAFIDSCDLHACLIVLRRAMRVRPEGVFSFRSCSQCLTVFVMSLIILITIRMCRACFDHEKKHNHLQTVLTLIHHLQTMSIDFVAETHCLALLMSCGLLPLCSSSLSPRFNCPPESTFHRLYSLLISSPDRITCCPIVLERPFHVCVAAFRPAFNHIPIVFVFLHHPYNYVPVALLNSSRLVALRFFLGLRLCSLGFRLASFPSGSSCPRTCLHLAASSRPVLYSRHELRSFAVSP